jgi:hypothetical protein
MAGLRLLLVLFTCLGFGLLVVFAIAFVSGVAQVIRARGGGVKS